ncbi:unnamed protein product [Ceutorhynchus assimilis]|uniref:Dynein regulatory complex protein 1 n=1 Tax=Ceutorhynchus assimilis TaxID=467358 RepID=A0A9N9MZP0_9CUCU|nr:unnamed protein product [Ceutorhynchus assimilis]
MINSRKSLCDTHELEPQLTSTDPNERKMARRLRIERRWEAFQKSKISLEQEELKHLEPEEFHEIHMQLKQSEELLEKFLNEGEEYITNVRIANDSREVDRRENEAINRIKIFEQLDEEAQAANELFGKIAKKWTSIQRHNDPLHINEAIIEQKEKCDMLINQKDAIIAMLNVEIKNAEKQFTKDQKKQIEDVNTLSNRIEKQISFMRKAYADELDVLEKVILTEREFQMEASDKKWDELFRKRQNQEISNTNAKFDQVELFNQKMDAVRIEFQEHYRATKIKLENEIEELERELEKIKALTLLNSEKLDYNYQILKKREDENIIIKSQQKRRMNKLQDVINALRVQIHDYETTMSNKIRKLKENIKKMHKSIMDVEAKADHFAHVNDDQFHSLWEMNKNRVLKVLRKILETDRLLYEQQMGLDWESPNNYMIDKTTLPSYKNALNHVPEEYIRADTTKPSAKQPPSKSAGSSSAMTGQEESSESAFEPMDEFAIANYRRIIKHILIKISDKSGFLTEKRLKELLKDYVDEHRQLVRLDNVFQALGIQGSNYIHILFKHFQPYTYCSICQGSLTMTASKMGSRIDSVGSQISSIFSKHGDGSHLMLPEVNELIEAVCQPNHVVAAIIADLVTGKSLISVGDDLSQLSEHERIDEICGTAAEPEQYSSPKEGSSVKPSAALKTSPSATAKDPDLWTCPFRHPLIISPVYVLQALREFVASYYVQKVGLPTTKARLERQRMTISRYISEKDMKLYWEKFKLNFGIDRVQVWEALLTGLKKYHEILKDRKLISNEVLELRNENADLKRLLANYLDHHDVMPPPCAKQQNKFGK